MPLFGDDQLGGTLQIDPERDVSAVDAEQLDRLEAVYRHEYSSLVRLAYALTSNSAEAEELVQDAFVDVFRRLDEVRNPQAYLRKAVVSRSRSLLRRRLVASKHPPKPPDPPDDLSPLAGHLWDVLGKLPERQRTAVVLKYYGGYRAADIAAMTDQPPSTVRSHLRRGLRQLKKDLRS